MEEAPPPPEPEQSKKQEPEEDQSPQRMIRCLPFTCAVLTWYGVWIMVSFLQCIHYATFHEHEPGYLNDPSPLLFDRYVYNHRTFGDYALWLFILTLIAGFLAIGVALSQKQLPLWLAIGVGGLALFGYIYNAMALVNSITVLTKMIKNMQMLDIPEKPPLRPRGPQFPLVNVTLPPIIPVYTVYTGPIVMDETATWIKVLLSGIFALVYVITVQPVFFVTDLLLKPAPAE